MPDMTGGSVTGGMTTMIEFVKTVRKNLQDPTEPEKTYALAQSRDRLELEDVAAHISSHNSKYNEGDVFAVINEALNCIREFLLDGYIVRMGKLGTFNIVLKSNGVAESVEDPKTKIKPVFSAADIIDIGIRYKPGKIFSNMRKDAKFRETITLKKRADGIKEQNTENAEGGKTEPDVEVHE